MFKVAAAIVPSNPAIKLRASASLLIKFRLLKEAKHFRSRVSRVYFASLWVAQQTRPKRPRSGNPTPKP
jgi:hypothetical protein